MRRFFTWLRWILTAGTLLIVVGIIAVMIYAQSDGFLRLAQKEALAAINKSINGVITWDRVEGTVLGSLRIYDLRLRYRGRDVFKAARADVEYSLLPLLWGRVQITRLSAAQPWLELRKDAEGDWTIVEALASGEPSTEPARWLFAVDGIAIEEGELLFEPESSKPEIYRVRRLNLGGAVRIAQNLDARVDRLGAWVEAEGAPQVYAQGALQYEQTTDTESLTLHKFWLQTAQSRVMLAGTVKDFDSFDSDLEITIGQLAAADLMRFVPGWPADIAVQGNASARGTGNALDTRFKLALAGAEISGTLHADVLSKTKPYSGDMAVRRLEISKVLPRKDFAGIVSADVKVAGSAIDVDSIRANGVISVQSAVVNRIDLGEIALQGTFSPKVADFTGRLRGPAGEASWRTHVALSARPEYRLELAVRSLNPAGVLKTHNPVPGELNFTGTVEGAGFDLNTMNARANIDVLQSQLRGVTVQQGKIVGQISRGRMQFQEVRLRATGASLSVQGEMGADPELPGRLDYRLEVTDLAPWLEIVERQGSGRLEVSGKASGNLSRLQTRGAVTLRELRLPEVAVESGRMDYALERNAGSPLPSGTINLDLTSVRAALGLARLQAAIKLPAPGARTVAVSANVRDQDGRNHRLLAEIDHQPQALLVRARELLLNLPDGSWRLAEPATITRTGDDYLIDRLILRNQQQLLSASGRFSPSGSQALDASIDRLSLATIKGYYPKTPDVTGVLSARAQIRGTAAAPVIEVTTDLTESKIAGQSYRGMRGSARYQNRNVSVDLTVAQDSTHSLEVRGIIPLALSWDLGWRAEPLAGMDIRARSAGISLGFLNALKPAAVENIKGEIALDIAVRGKLTAPEPVGTFQMRDGAFDAKGLGVKLSDLTVQGSADPARISLSRFSARSGDGTLLGNGVVSLRQFALENINLTVAAHRWPAIQTSEYKAVINGTVRMNGQLDAPRITGAVEVIEGTVRPALDFLDRNPVPLKRDPSIIVVQHRGGKPVAAETGEKNGAKNDELVRRMTLEVSINVPNNFWIRHPNANVELRGKLTVLKNRESSDPTLAGLLEVVRGWVGFQGRRFMITRGRVQFTGGPPKDATVDLTAEYRVNDYLVNASLSGTIEKPALVLASTPQLEQSDILSLLLFGKPVAELSNSEQASLQRSAVDLSAGFAAAALGNAVSKALGLQELGIDLGDLTFTGGQVRFGRYLGARTYISAAQEVSGKNGREVSLEFQLAPEWRIGATTRNGGGSGVDIIWRKRY
jgi:autotransporter translocation and assembly factor TamB